MADNAASDLATRFNPIPLIAEELGISERNVAACAALLAEGSTVPFIARYRKEATGGLDEVQIRDIEERRTYLTELDERRQSILASVREQGKLTPELEQRLLGCTTKATLEDLYLPFKPKRRTRATIAKEKGLEPLARLILQQPTKGSVSEQAQGFIDLEKGVEDVEAAIAGARDIIAELAAEDADLRASARETFAKDGTLVSERVVDKTQEPTKFEQYYEFNEAVASIPSHRFLALRRGEREGVLKVGIDVDAERVLPRMRQKYAMNPASPFAKPLEEALVDGYHRLLAPSVETDVRVDLKLRSDREAVDVFANNLRNLLLAAPLGDKSVVGIDPGLRTGCKCVALSATGKFLENITIYLSQGEAAQGRAQKELVAFMQRHTPRCIAIGNGTGGRETEAFVRRVVTEAGQEGVIVVAVNESGASVYSASDIARDEFPELDVTVRGAISIGRRLQDPLAELVKIDPKAIGVGQYQHDVHQPMLARKLDEVVESCVNHVGVEVNTASAPLLARVAGIGPALAKKIVAYREEHGAYKGRLALRQVPGMGPRSFEQAAGFLRVRDGEHPLDASAVHPERYELVAHIARDLNVDVAALVGNTALAQNIDIPRYVDDTVGEPTLRDIVAELQKPGRDPRAEFTPPKFRDDVFEMSHLKPGMEFDGVVTNVTAFGAFVDVGVHQDGLVHISQLADRFVKDPNEVVKVGDKLKVRVLEVDLPRKRISLTARRGAEAPRPAAAAGEAAPGNAPHGGRDPRGGSRPSQAGAKRGGGGGGGGKSEQAGPKFSNNPFAKLRTR